MSRFGSGPRDFNIPFRKKRIRLEGIMTNPTPLNPGMSKPLRLGQVLLDRSATTHKKLQILMRPPGSYLLLAYIPIHRLPEPTLLSGSRAQERRAPHKS